MTTIMKSINDTTVNVLGSVSTVANTVSKVINSTASSLDMLDAFVQQSKMKQLTRIAAENETYIEDVINTAALEAAAAQDELDKALASNNNLAKHFATFRTRIEASVKNSISPST